MRFYLIALLLALMVGLTACGDDDLPENCFRDDGEVQCVNQGGGDDDGEWEGDDD